MKTTKRLLAVLLALVILCVGVPLAAQAEGTLAPTGSCGDGVTWTFDADTGELTISGEGAMTDYDYSNGVASPFSDHSEIQSLIVNSGVTSIGDRSFMDCSSLMNVTMGNSVVEIGKTAFERCEALTSVIIPKNVTTIGDNAFFGCESLTEVSIPQRVTSIGLNAFSGCSALTSISVDDNNSFYFADEDGCLYNKDKTTLLQYPTGNERTSFLVPDEVTTIGTLAFFLCKSLSNVTIPDSVTDMGDGAFLDCSNLESIIIPSSLTSISYSAFAYCVGLKSVVIPSSVVTIGEYAFCECSSLKDVYYCGSPASWESLIISEANEPLQNAVLHFHNPQIGQYVPATCTEEGYAPFYCTYCGKLTSVSDPQAPLGHNMQPTYIWAKDDSTVTATMVCTRCDKTGATETAEVKTEITVKPTCSTEGVLTLIAAFNNKSFYGQTKTKTLPRDPDAHVFKVTVTPPTCLDDGYTTHACTLCRYGYSDEIVAALGHDYQHHDAKAPTCEAPGWDAYDTCSRCDYTTYSELATVDHDDADNDGKCDMCGDQMRGGSHCKYCGKVHNGNFFDKLTGFFHRILAIFKR